MRGSRRENRNQSEQESERTGIRANRKKKNKKVRLKINDQKRKSNHNQIQTEMNIWSNGVRKKQIKGDTSDNQTDKKYTSKTH